MEDRCPRGSINMAEVKRIYEMPEINNKTFALKTQARVFLLQAHDEAECISWLSKLRVIKRKLDVIRLQRMLRAAFFSVFLKIDCEISLSNKPLHSQPHTVPAPSTSSTITSSVAPCSPSESSPYSASSSSSGAVSCSNSTLPSPLKSKLDQLGPRGKLEMLTSTVAAFPELTDSLLDSLQAHTTSPHILAYMERNVLRLYALCTGAGAAGWSLGHYYHLTDSTSSSSPDMYAGGDEIGWHGDVPVSSPSSEDGSDLSAGAERLKSPNLQSEKPSRLWLE